MLKNNKNPLIYMTSTREYFCAYWGQDIRLFKNLFWISATICFVFLLTYIGSYNIVFYMNINNPELNANQDLIEICIKTVIGVLNIIITLIIGYLYFYKKNLITHFFIIVVL